MLSGNATKITTGIQRPLTTADAAAIAPQAGPVGPRHGAALESDEELWQASRTRVDTVELRMRTAAEADGILGRAARHHLASNGKRLRARLALAASKALGLTDRVGLELAASVELLHEASLVHDDLQDGDSERRGRPTVWAHFGRDVALLLGDHLIAQSFTTLATLGGDAAPTLIAHHSRAVRALAEGQMSDVVCWNEASATRDRYDEVARLKTGTLLALPVVGACELAHLNELHMGRVLESQGWLGVAFQVLNDLADVLGADRRRPGTDERLGRPNAVHLEAGSTRAPEVRIEAQLREALEAAARARTGLPRRLACVLEGFAAEIERKAARVRLTAGGAA